ncbi:ATPase [Actinomyces sp. oral taxon 414]|uniref:McrB family protein n=1 Tax=Actinomyces sp. oral taxon 414 TaxID=712122 RepID=UPI0006AE1DDF|nr:AAA family ATPase [Actinomyces sp. oral taxon 414]ALD00081.1 ATPase [Actinomyces sp. oral taxon 414]
MAIPKISKQNIADALKYIDEKGVPFHNQSTKYELVTEDGKKYPPKYVISVAAHIATGEEVSTEGFNAVEAKFYLQGQGFNIEVKQEKFEITITADGVTSTDERFTMDNLSLGDNYKPLNAYLQKADGEVIKRTYSKGERRNSNQTMPRIACQVFEKQIASLSVEGRESFPVCKYNPSSETICGIYTSVEEFRQHRKTIEYLTYSYDNGRQFVLYCWNAFSTIIFVQECLKRFGEPGDKMILTYREKDEQEEQEATAEAAAQEELVQQFKGYQNPFSSMLIESKNLIFRGAPGTGKSYLAKEIAADIISNGYYEKFTQLSEEQRKQVEFVQFHPSYDYSDFMEGLRPKVNDDGTMGFELQDGIFKKFIARARKNYEDSQKSKKAIEKEVSVQESMTDFFSGIELGVDTFKTINGNEFTITSVDESHINISIPGNATVNKLALNVDEIRRMLESDVKFTKIKDITAFFGKTFATQAYSYDFAIYKAIKSKKASSAKGKTKQAELKKYIFIIDEINRGEISKIFGELFFAIDPGYRGRAGEISTQYANLHADPDEKFYIPENVYIIGTMNDIDRSVDSFDFAMRRRFRFVELKADERLEMLANLEDEELEAEAIRRMSALNREIAAVEDLNENYQIGASYFLKLKTLTFDQLWTDYLHPLLQEYIQGMYDEEGIMNRLAKAYGCHKSADGDTDEAAQD